MKYKLVLPLFFCCYVTLCDAQLEIKYNGEEVNYSTNKIYFTLLDTDRLTDSTLLAIKKEDWRILNKNKPKISYSPQTTWLKINIDDIKKYGEFDYVNIDNPHINFLKCWVVKGDSIIKNFINTGDNLPFGTKPMATASFVFALNSSEYENSFIIVAADKRFTKLDLPVIFCTRNYFVSKNTQTTVFYGIAIGFCTLLLLFNLYLLVSLKKTFYAWYSIYLALVCLYFFINSGLFFQYVTPDFPILNDILRPLIFCLIELPLALFFVELLELKSRFKKLYITNKIVILFYVTEYTIALISLTSNSFQLHGFLLKISGYTLFPFLMFYIVQAGYLVKKKIPFANFALASFTLFFVFTTVYSLNQKELITTFTFAKQANYWAIISETIIATSLLVWQYKFYRDQALHLQVKNNQLQKEIYKETVAWQEKELIRLSSLLHDTVGANLGFLRLEIDNMPLNQEGKNNIANHIANIGNEVRSMSHTFSPFILKNKGLYESIYEQVKNININGSTNIQFEWFGEKNAIPFSYQAIVFQITHELLQNIAKHAKAQTAFLQVLIEQNIINIYAEDDGIGFVQNKTSEGIGLKNMENLVQLLQGSFNIETNKGEGVSISIEFKIQLYESV